LGFRRKQKKKEVRKVFPPKGEDKQVTQAFTTGVRMGVPFQKNAPNKQFVATEGASRGPTKKRMGGGSLFRNTAEWGVNGHVMQKQRKDEAEQTKGETERGKEAKPINEGKCEESDRELRYQRHDWGTDKTKCSEREPKENHEW